MATQDRTGRTLSYLGHPCSIRPLQDRQDDDDANRLRNQDIRDLVQRIGRTLDELELRGLHGHLGLKEIQEQVDRVDDEGLPALLDMAQDYAGGTLGTICHLRDLVLAALEKSDLIAQSRQAAGRGAA